MATNLGELIFTLSLADEGFGAKIAGARTQMQGLGSSASQEMGNMGKSISKAGQSFLPFSLAAGAAIGVSVKAAETFNQSMELVHTQAGASQKEVDNLTQSVLKLAPAVGQSPKALADALFYIESSGFRGAKAMDVLKLSAEGAAVGQTDVASTANALTSILNTQIRGAENATTAMGNLNAIVGAGKMHFADLNSAIGTGFFSAAATFGVSLQSAGAAIAELTRQGVGADNAATRLRMSMTLMATPTAQAAKVLSAAGFSMSDIKTNSDAMTQALTQANVTTSEMAADLQKPNGFSVAIQDMKDHLYKAGITGSDAAAVISKAFGGGRSSGPILQMINDTSGLDNAFNQITTSSNNFGEAWQKQQQQSKQKMDDFKATLQVVMVQLGNAVLPTLDKLISFVGGVANAFGGLSGTMKTVIGGGLLLVAGLAPVLIIFGKMATGISSLIGLFGGATVATEGLAAASGGGLLAALGGAAAAIAPVALGIGAVAAVGVGAAVIVNRLATEHRNAASAAAAQDGKTEALVKTLGTSSGAHTIAVNIVETLRQKTSDAATATDDLNKKQSAAKTAAANFTDAQKAANDALQKYGPNSKQFIDAVAHEVEMNRNLDSANQSLDKSMQKNKDTHGALAEAMKDLNGVYSAQQIMAKANDIASNGLAKAKDAEKQAHQKTADAAKNYSVALAIAGPYSDQARDAGNKLTGSKKDEASKTGDVAYWQGQVNDLHKNAPQLTKNLQSALGPLIGQYNNLAGAASNAYNKEQSALNVRAPAGSMFQNLNPSHRAGGGPVSANTPYIIGEDGPEIYIPSSSGVILPNNTKSNATPAGSAAYNFNGANFFFNTKAAVQEFFSVGNRNIALEMQGGSPLAGTTRV